MAISNIEWSALASIVAGAVWLGNLQGKVNALDSNEIKKQTTQALKVIEEARGQTNSTTLPLGNQLPIGAIIPVYFKVTESKIYNFIPKNWVLCDGKTINSEHPQQFKQDDVDKSFWNINSPDLHDRFIKGWKSEDDLLKPGGSNTNEHTHRGITSGTNQHGPSQGASLGSNNNVTLPERSHQHNFSSENNSDESNPYANAPSYISMYYIMKVGN